jgi:DNA replication protein DnaC
MERIGEIINKKTPTNTSAAPTGTSSGVKAESKQAKSDVCPLCRGAGFVHPLLPDGQTDYRNAVPCKCARKAEAGKRRLRLEEYSNLGALKNFTFDKLSPQGRNGANASQQRFSAAFEAARKFAVEPAGWLVFIGPSGSGKTHLTAAVANDRIGRDAPVFFITAADLLDHLRAAFNPDSDMTYDRLFEQVRNTPLLILDDLGMQSGTPWAQEKLDQLLNHRFSNELPTIITSEKPLAEMDERLRSRLGDAGLCQIFSLEEDAGEADCNWGAGLELQKSMTFASFDYRRVNLPQEQQDNLERAYRLALDFAKSPEGWLVFQGNTGCGKTHLAAAIVNFRYQARKPAMFVVVPEFLDHLRSTFSPDSKVTYDQMFERVKTTPLLVLDDFGEQSATQWAQEKLYQVINYRYNAQLPTVITTSRALEELEGRISSRLADAKMSTPFNITAPDYRTDIRSSGPVKKPYLKRGRGARES